jgi:uncharacterized membrane protein YhaH (DUF805 family)
MHWMLMPYRRYADFSGRSRRMEYWMFQLFNLIVVALCYALILGGGGYRLLLGGLAAANNQSPGTELSGVAAPGPIFWVGVAVLAIYALATFIPSIAVIVRRLHDRNMSGWYLLGFIVAVIVLSLIPVIGQILVFAGEIGYIVIMALPGTAGPNKYGPDPLDPNQAEVFA